MSPGDAALQGGFLLELVLEVWLRQQDDLEKLLGLGLLVRHGVEGVQVLGVNRLGLIQDQDDGATRLILFKEKHAEGCFQVHEVSHDGLYEGSKDEPQESGGGGGRGVCQL